MWQSISQYFYIILFSGLILLTLTPLSWWTCTFKWTFKIIFYALASPFHLWRWWHSYRITHKRRKNYELLGDYVALFGNNSDLLTYFKTLIESGIAPREFKKLLKTNLCNLKAFEAANQKEMIKAKAEEQKEMQKISAEQQDLLLQSRVSLEQIKFREKLLEELYQKIQKKYRL